MLKVAFAADLTKFCLYVLDLKAAISAAAAKWCFVRLGDLTTSIKLQQRINVCFGEAALQRARPTRTVVLGGSRDFAKYTICA